MNRKAIGVLALALAAGAASAADRVTFYNTDGSNSQDGFVADLAYNGYNNPIGDFVTFCVEFDEHHADNKEYEYTISQEVMDNGGAGNTALNTTDGRRVAYLFSIFAAGGESALRGLDATFAGYSDQQTRILFQRYIWDRFSYPNGDDWSYGTMYSDARFDLLSSIADLNGAQAGLHGVRVMNVWEVGHAGDNNYGSQDMLTMMIPLPSTAGLAMVGLGGLGVIRRRRA